MKNGKIQHEARKPKILVMGTITDPIREAGGIPIYRNATNRVGLKDAIAEVDGLLLCGGADVNPRIYAEQVHESVYGISPDRDRAECIALLHAKNRNLPVYGICRGMQVMNVAAGGSLIQHLPDELDHDDHRGGRHDVWTEEGTRVFDIFGGVWSPDPVVSIHHQAVAQLGHDLRPTAWAEDGTVEAIESRDSKWVGVQFHPEYAPDDEASKRFFKQLVLAAAEMLPLRPAPRPLKKKRNNRRTQAPAPLHPNLRLSWRCFSCRGGLDFEHERDYRDHCEILHGVSIAQEGTE